MADLDGAGLESMMLTASLEMDGNRYEEMFRRMNPPGCGTMYFTTGLALSSSIGFLRGGYPNPFLNLLTHRIWPNLAF